MPEQTQTLPPEMAGFDTFTLVELGFVPILLSLLVIGFFSTYIARKKGYSGSILIWAWIPVLNIYGLLMFIGLPDLFVRAKVDALAARLVPPNTKTPAPGMEK